VTKALTLWQPWASLIAWGEKKIETRCWATRYRGPLLIHAAKRPFKLESFAENRHYVDVFRRREILKPEDLPLGCIVARAELKACIPTSIDYAHAVYEDDPAEYSFGDFSEGRYAWVLENVMALPEPIPARGGQGLWTYIPKPQPE